ncbi:T9SS C-terminal target domain-containing protein [Aquimarina sp. AD1]|uniref:cellulase family glycosylhydrolase n=1 Tax=Aquimarina sp. (strain AD1) TaxID=1714848 RepID=UPI000E4AC216|nr:cellulase family glycosylhydrolase [Aquimarina sp. AD1]AXT54814.1 T9SS C-terminal target domain-containing protein [Aquimarina sp. AD1]RKN20401.1 T9SS C-terminal target domain-containing protein [Aquimarina sp. AD1]
MKLNFTRQKQLSTLILFLIFNSFSYAQTVVERYGRLQVNGSHVTAENGEKISLAGMSLFWSNAGDGGDFYNSQTINHLADDWKNPIIRAALGVKEDWDGGTGYIDNTAAQKAKIRTVIDAAIAKGVYVIIDWHTHAAEVYKDEAVAFFTEMAELYGNNDHVIYEIYNEPINQSWNDVKNYANDVIAGIRSKDPDNLIIVGSPTWSQDVDQAAANPITGDPNLAYTLHFYANTHKQFLRDRALAAMNSGIALFVTEWGTTDASGNGGYNPQESQVWLDFMIENHISYVNWTVSHKPEDSCVVSPNMGVQGLINGNLTTSGIFIRNHLLARAATLSVDDFTINNEKLSLDQNPVNEILSINSNTVIDDLTIYDMNGRSVFHKDTNENNPQVNINTLNSGNYILKVSSNSNTTTTKFVKH